MSVVNCILGMPFSASHKPVLNEALGADAFAGLVSAVVCERIRLGHKENTYDPPSQNDARRTRAS